MDLLKNLDENLLNQDNFNISAFLLSKNINKIQDYERDLVLLQHDKSIKTVELIYNNYNNFINTSQLIKFDKDYLDAVEDDLGAFRLKLNVS